MTTFKGDITHEVLARKLFPWVEDVRANFNLTEKLTANGFLGILINMRWVILHDCALLIKKHNMNRLIITYIPEILN